MSVEIFFCYAHEDKNLLNKLKTHLDPLRRKGLIDVWYDRDISAGTEWEREIDKHLNAAHIILLLVSPDFIASDYCYSIEMKRAMERHERGEARVVPIILRPSLWQETSLRNLQALPRDGKPIIDRSWGTQDKALLNVVEGIDITVKQLTIELRNVILESDKSVSENKPDELILLSTLEGHSSSVYSVAISPDGNTLVSGSDDETIKVWDLPSGKLLRTILWHIDAILSVAISPDGLTLAVGSADNTITLWNLQSGQMLHTFAGHTSGVWSVAFSSDGQLLASGSEDKTIKIWNRSSGELLTTLEGNQKIVYSVAFSPNGQALLSGGDDNTIKLWNLLTGKLLHTFLRRSDTIFRVGLAISPDGQILASGTSDAMIRLWKLPEGELFTILKGHSGEVMSVAFSSDGQTLASICSEGVIKVWNPHTKKLLHTSKGLLKNNFPCIIDTRIAK